MRARTLASAFAVAIAGCAARDAVSTSQHPREVPASPRASALGPSAAPPRERQAPPEPARVPALPAATRTTLANGMRVAVVPARALPLVQVRLVIAAGSASAAPGVADVLARAVADGATKDETSAHRADALAAIGARLATEVHPDGAVFAIAIAREHLDAALALVAGAILRAKLDDSDLRRARERVATDAEEAAREDGSWLAMHAALRMALAGTPYAATSASRDEAGRVGAGAARDLYARAYVPRAAELVIVGDADPEAATAAATRAFGAWTGGDPLPQDRPISTMPAGAASSWVVVDRPRHEAADVVVAARGIDRAAPGWAAARVAAEVLRARLAARLPEPARVAIVELARAPSPWLVFAHVPAAQALDAARLVEDEMDRAGSGPSLAEIDQARPFLAGALVRPADTLAGIADLFVEARELDLGDGALDRVRAGIRAVTPDMAAAAAKEALAPSGRAIAIAADASALPTPASPLLVVDPENDFQPSRTLGLPPDAGASDGDASP